MEKANKLAYPESMYEGDMRTDPSIIPAKAVMSYSRANRSAASKPDRIVNCEEAYQVRRDVNKY